MATEVERAINAAYGDDRKIQIVRNVDDEININLSKLNADGSTSSLTTPISVDLLSDSYVTSQQVGGENRINLTGASPDFTKEEFLAHTQDRINNALNTYASASAANLAALGVEDLQFQRTAGAAMTAIYGVNDVVSFEHTNTIYGAGASNKDEKYLAYSYFENQPNLSVYDESRAVKPAGGGASGNTVELSLIHI